MENSSLRICSQDYAQKLQRDCTFTNWAAGSIFALKTSCVCFHFLVFEKLTHKNVLFLAMQREGGGGGVAGSVITRMIYEWGPLPQSMRKRGESVWKWNITGSHIFFSSSTNLVRREGGGGRHGRKTLCVGHVIKGLFHEMVWYVYTANEGPVRIQNKCLDLIYEFPEMKLCSLLISKTELQYKVLSPNSYIHISARDLYISRIGLSILLQLNMWPILGIYKSLTDTWMWKNWDWGRAIPRKGIHKWNFVAVYLKLLAQRLELRLVLIYSQAPLWIKNRSDHALCSYWHWI